MNFEDDKWNIADEQFNQWQIGNKIERSIDLTDILKSTYLVFREKQRNRIESFCNQSLEYLKKQESNTICYSISGPDIRFSKKVQFNEDLLSENEPMFSRSFERLEPSHYERFTKENNNRIIKGILSGDPKIFNNLYEYEYPKIVRLVTMNTKNLDDAQDIFQDGIVILIERVYRKDLDLTCSVSTYLYSICRNLLMEQVRKNQKSISLNDPYNHLNPEITFIAEESMPDVFVSVTRAIETLGDPCKQLLESFYYQKLSWGEIASLLGYSTPASARNQKYKCLEKIRSMASYEEV